MKVHELNAVRHIAVKLFSSIFEHAATELATMCFLNAVKSGVGNFHLYQSTQCAIFGNKAFGVVGPCMTPV